jgi:hypothetical protein
MQIAGGIVLGAVVFMGSAVVALGGDAPSRNLFSRHGVNLDLPPDVRAEEKTGPDFFLYYFLEKEKGQILFAYFGFAPSFPNAAPPNSAVVTETIGGFPTKSIKWRNPDGRFCRESLVQVSEKGWLQFVHFIYSGLSDEASKRADSIIASLRYTASQSEK